MQKFPGRLGSADGPVQDLVPVDIVAVHGVIATSVCLHHGTIETDSCEETFAARVSKNLRVEPEIGGGRGFAAHRAS